MTLYFVIIILFYLFIGPFHESVHLIYHSSRFYQAPIRIIDSEWYDLSLLQISPNLHSLVTSVCTCNFGTWKTKHAQQILDIYLCLNSVFIFKIKVNGLDRIEFMDQQVQPLALLL